MLRLNMTQEHLQEASQGILQSRAHARSVEALMDALLPFASNDETKAKMRTTRTHAFTISVIMLELYQAIAPVAMGEDSDDG